MSAGRWGQSEDGGGQSVPGLSPDHSWFAGCLWHSLVSPVSTFISHGAHSVSVSSHNHLFIRL